MTTNNKNLKLAIQKEGRLTDETLEFLRKSGFSFESYKQRLFSLCRNFPLEILYVRDDDIAGYVSSGVVDLGIVGQNILNEARLQVRKLLNLRFGFCSLILAVPKESDIKSLKDLAGKVIATTYPLSVKQFLNQNEIAAKVIQISGSVEIAPALGVAEAIADLTSSGSTLALNDLRILDKIYDSEAVLITNKNVLESDKKKKLLDSLVIRFQAILSAGQYKYVSMSVPKILLSKLKKVIPGIYFDINSSIEDIKNVSVKVVMKEDVFWENLERYKKYGLSNFILIPLEKIIN